MSIPSKAELVARAEAQLCPKYPSSKGEYDSGHWRVGVMQSDIYTSKGLAFEKDEHVLFSVVTWHFEHPVLAFSFRNNINTGLRFNDIREVDPSDNPDLSCQRAAEAVN